MNIQRCSFCRPYILLSFKSRMEKQEGVPEESSGIMPVEAEASERTNVTAWSHMMGPHPRQKASISHLDDIMLLLFLSLVIVASDPLVFCHPFSVAQRLSFKSRMTRVGGNMGRLRFRARSPSGSSAQVLPHTEGDSNSSDTKEQDGD